MRRHLAGAADFAARLRGVSVTDVVRRGKFLWLTLDSGEALLAHLGMSGQLVLQPPDAADGDAPARAGRRSTAAPAASCGSSTSGCSAGSPSSRSTPTPDGLPGGLGALGEPVLPVPVVHIARDALDPHLDETALATRLRRKRTGLKRALLDQQLVSGIGNIYADEALWRSKLHYARPTETLTRPAVASVLASTREVMREALDAGRDVVRQPLRRRQRQQRLLRAVAGRLRAGGRALPAVRDAGAAGRVHEPVLVHLPAVPAAAAQRPLVRV